MADYLVTDTELTSVANAIRVKGGTSATLRFPTEFVTAIEDIPTGGGGGSTASLSDPIRFFDYDGSLVASYDSVPSELPANPSHSGLVAQGWNYTLAQIQAQFIASGVCDIGQMYVTESGDTEIDIVLYDGRLSPYLGLAPKGTVTIDWGDNSATNTVSGTSLTTQKRTQHTYAVAGAYTISVHVETGSVALYGTLVYPLLNKNNSQLNVNNVYASCVRSVRVGSQAAIGGYALCHCYGLTSVTIPSEVTSIGTYAFQNCYNLKSIVIPSGVTSLGNNMFSNCYSLTSVTIPSGVANIGTSVFSNCDSLTSVTIPSGVTSIGNNMFSNCYSLTSVTIPSRVTSIWNYAFQNCYSLKSIVIPSGVTSLRTAVFSNCYSLTSVTIPSRVTSIAANTFANLYGLGEIHFSPTTPPAVANKNAWSNLQTDCKIYVPTGTLATYQAATNYPGPATYTYVEE